ncbi:hypothetical protein ACPB8Q_03945 [Methanocaldococcus indicus]|uniref:hypothetical protein n=1 Tax=Methanocaldococcus indicus TaxID=213231 RepID=UPI003C6DA572
MTKKIDPLFVSALYYGINKGINNIIGSGGKVLGRIVSKEIITFLEEFGIKNVDIKKLFTEIFGLAEDLKIVEDDEKVIFTVVNPTLKEFLKKSMEEKIQLYICPFIHLLSELYSKDKDYKLMLLNVEPISENEVNLIFKKVKRNE